jgi:hypothetical protein
MRLSYPIDAFDVTCVGSYNVHGFNLIFMMGELMLNNIPIVWSHSIFVMIWLFACKLHVPCSAKLLP